MLNENDTAQYIETIQYYDGLGRPFINVQKRVTPNHSNLMSLQEYDELGRESKSWLPLAIASDYVTPDAFKNSISDSYNGDSRPFNEPIYEASPLNRIVKQYGAGYEWVNHPVSTSYMTNTSSGELCCKLYSVNSFGTLDQNGNYGPGELYVTQVTDEDGNLSYIFTDKRKRQILFRQIINTISHNDTYYVYDDFDNQCFVLPPSFQDNPDLGLYAYQYKYDDRNRCVEKKLPGCASVCYIYDCNDHLILSQDGIQYHKGEWTLFLYDAFNRLAVTGIMQTEKNRETLSALYKDLFLNVLFTGVWASDLNEENYFLGYRLSSPLPANANFRGLTANYYDNYDFLDYLFYDCFGYEDMSYDSSENSIFGENNSRPLGFLTGTYIRQLDDLSKGEFVTYYYNIEGREIQKRSRMLPDGFLNFTSTKYNFTGQPLYIKKQHISNYYIYPYWPNDPRGSNNQKELYEFEYDHAGRLVNTYHTHNDGQKVLLSKSTFDPLGRLQEKKRHNEQDAIQYTYNIRNWLTSIKSLGFEQELFHNTPSFPEVTPCFNGNISAIKYRQNGSDSNFSFSYDQLNRLKSARTFDPLANVNQNLETYEYDRMGNITFLERKLDNSITDRLSIYYTGNQIKSVSNSSPPSNIGFGVMSYPDLADKEIEYFYDPNGNLCKNLDKEIVSSRYNCLNLPDTIQFRNGNQIINSYLADGRKVRTAYKTYMTNIVVPLDSVYHGRDLTTQSVDEWNENYMYRNTGVSYNTSPQMFMVQTPEGYIGADHVGIDSRRNYAYYYYTHDHLGNVRIARNSQGYYEDQSLEYYPSGVLFSRSVSPGRQPYMFGGKELISMHGLNEYDFTARMQDPIIPRFTTVDPLCEKYPWMSTYSYCLGNPIRFWDPDGKAPQDPPTGVGLHNWSRDKQIRVANIVQSMNAAGNRIFKGTSISASASAWSVEGNIGVGSVKGKLSLGVVNVSAKTDGMGVSTTASLGETTGEMSVSSASAEAGITIAEGKANIAKNDAGLSFDAISADAKVQVGSNPCAKLDDQGRISAGVKAGPVKVNVSFSLQAAGEWFNGAIKLISELLSPEIRMDTRRNQNNH